MQVSDDVDWVIQRADVTNDLTSGETAPSRDHTTNTYAGHYITVTTKRPNFKGASFLTTLALLKKLIFKETYLRRVQAWNS